MHFLKNWFVVSTLLLVCFTSCKNEKSSSSKRTGANEVIIHELADPDKLNPVTSNSANATYVETNIFMYLLQADKEKLEIIPGLAKSRPIIEQITDGPFQGGIKLTYEINEKAVWDDGSPVLASDVEFTYKCILNPLVDNESLRPYLDFLQEFIYYPENPRKFTIVSNQKYYLAEFSSGNVFIIPEKIYDPKGLIKNYSIKDFANKNLLDEIKSNPKNQEFAKEFNGEKFQREKGFISGCGPYRFERWVTGQKIELVKKENWWGDKAGFKAYPSKINYEIINDWSAVSSSLRSEALDLVQGIRPKDFITLKDEKVTSGNYRFEEPQEMSYVYIGLNMKDPRLADKSVRQALAHCVNQEEIINSLVYGLATPCNGPILPMKKYYNADIKPFEFNVEKASKLLDEAGWKDSDGNGIRDKMLSGKLQQLSFNIRYNSGNDTREKICLMLKENAKAAGIEVNPQVKEWTVFLEENKNHLFDMYVGGWVSEAIGDDPKQIWHTSSYDGGSNYVGFGNQASDALIDEIRAELNEDKRNELFKKFQILVKEEVPYIFLYSPKNRIIMHRRFEKANVYVARPGYDQMEFNDPKALAKP